MAEPNPNLLIEVVSTLAQQVVNHPDQALPILDRTITVIQTIADLVKSTPILQSALASRLQKTPVVATGQQG